MRNETCTDSLADERREVRGHDAHLRVQVATERLAVRSQFGGALGEHHDVLHVGLGEILTHGNPSGIDNCTCNSLVIADDPGKLIEAILSEGLLIADEESASGVLLVVADNANQLGEVPAVPFPHPHGEGVDGLVEVVDGRNGLNDVVVVLLHAELDLGTTVRMSKTQLSTGDIAGLQALEELLGVQSHATEKVTRQLAGLGCLALNAGEFGFDASRQILIAHTQNHLALLSCLGQVGLKHRAQVVAHETLGDLVGVLQSLAGTLEWREGHQLHHLAEASEISMTLLDFLLARANGVGLELDREDCIAHARFVEEIVDGRHGWRRRFHDRLKYMSN